MYSLFVLFGILFFALTHILFIIRFCHWSSESFSLCVWFYWNQFFSMLSLRFFYFFLCSEFDRSRRVVILLSFDLFYWVTLLFFPSLSLSVCICCLLCVSLRVCRGVCVCAFFRSLFLFYFCWLFQCWPLNCLHLQRLRGRLSRPIVRSIVYTGCLRQAKIGRCVLCGCDSNNIWDVKYLLDFVAGCRLWEYTYRIDCLLYCIHSIFYARK